MILVNIVLANKINLLYTANINATYKNCECASNPLGGIDRLKTFIDEFRSKNNNILFIDGGNFFNSYSFPELNTKALQSLSSLNYDLFMPGIHIFFEEKYLYNDFSKKYFEKIVCSNTNLKLKNHKDIFLNNKKIRIYGYISPNLFKHTKQPQWLKLNNQPANLEYIKNGINIIIFNGYLDDAKLFLKKYSLFDILLLSTDQQTGSWNIGKTTIIGGGHDAESIALVEIFDKENIHDFSVKYFEMDSSIESDTAILNIFESSNLKKVK